MGTELWPFCRAFSPLVQWASLGGEPGLQGGATTLPTARDQGVAEPFGASGLQAVCGAFADGQNFGCFGAGSKRKSGLGPGGCGGEEIAGEFGQTWERNFRRNGDRKRWNMLRVNPGADIGLDQKFPVFDDPSGEQSGPITFRPIRGERGDVLKRNV